MRVATLIRYCVFAFLLMPLWGNAITEPPVVSATEGVAVGSAGFNNMLGQQIQPGMLSTEHQADDSFLLVNKLQNLSAHITPQGVNFESIGNSANKGGFTLSLVQWGRRDALQMAISSSLYQEDNAVFHTHLASDQNLGIAEKFTNIGNGIRQDFILPVKPQGTGALHVQLQAQGAAAHEKKDGIIIVLDSGRQLTYDRLVVTDSAGKNIPAYFVLAQNNIIDIVVDDKTARYPLVIDPTVADDNWISVGAVNGVNNTVKALATDGSNVYVAGQFQVAGDASAVGVAKWNGSSWSAMPGLTDVTAIKVDSLGNVYAAAWTSLYKWSGSNWLTIGSGNNSIYALALDANNNLYVAGAFRTFNTLTVNGIAKWNGTSWSALGSGVGNGIYSFPLVSAVICDNAGNVYIGGPFYTAGGVTARFVAKWNGSTWSALGAGVGTSGGGNSVVYGMALDAANNLYIGGDFSGAGTNPNVRNIAKWDGSTWSPVGTGSHTNNGLINTLAFNAGGTLYAAGSFSSIAGIPANNVAKWNGSVWSSLASGVDSAVSGLVVDASGNIYIGGLFNVAGSLATDNIARWSGAAWSALSPAIVGIKGGGTVFAVTLHDGNLYAAGQFVTAGGAVVNNIAKWNGSSWSPLGSGINGVVYALAHDSNGNIYAGGQFTSAGGVTVNNIAIWNGSNWQSPDTGLTGFMSVVKSIFIDKNNYVYAAGNFDYAGAIAVNNIAKWNGSQWSALGSGIDVLGNYNHVLALVMDATGNLYVGGGFTSAGGISAPNIAKWNGSIWSALGSSASVSAHTLAIDNQGNLFAGGGAKISKWNGSIWTTISSNIKQSTNSGSIVELQFDNSNNLYATGSFTKIDEVPVVNIAKWNGTTWQALGSGLNSTTQALIFDGQGRLYVGGNFSSAGNKVSSAAALWLLDSDSDGNVDIADTDDDNDTLADGLDNCSAIFNGSQLNTDGDTLGDVCDSDDDNDGAADTSDIFPLNAAASSDSDNDGFPGSWSASCNAACQLASGLTLDNCPSNTNADQLNTDGDAQGNACDSDDDNDGVVDTTDKFPLDASETLDTDNDGIGNNADTDDDNDGVPDGFDSTPLGQPMPLTGSYQGSSIQEQQAAQ